MIEKITAIAVRGFLCLKKFNSETIKRIAEDVISHQIARHQQPPAHQEETSNRTVERVRACKLSLSAETAFAEIKFARVKRSRRFSILLICSLVGLQLAVKAQTQGNEIKQITIGSKLSESFWLKQHLVYAAGKTSRQSLLRYKNQLLILDFWATWCSSCTKRFKYIDSLQKEYEGQAVILLVDDVSTRDTPDKIARTMKRFDNQLVTIVSDSTLTKQFTHTTVPHYVWIAGGYFLAATGSELMHKRNLDAILNRQQVLKEVNTPH